MAARRLSRTREAAVREVGPVAMAMVALQEATGAEEEEQLEVGWAGATSVALAAMVGAEVVWVAVMARWARRAARAAMV